MRISSLYLASVLGLGVALSGCSTKGPGSSQQTFDTPDAAAEAFFKAISKNDTTALLAIFGPSSRALVIPADQVQAARERQVLTAAMIERWWLEGDSNTRTIVVGNESYPLPVPLVQEKGKWRFDTDAGKDEVLFRRIGRNELAAMEVSSAFVQAQDEYAAKSHDGVPKGVFAQRVVSDSGKHNGLYWPPTGKDTAQSPMGELAAEASAEGYGGKDVRTAPYHGYLFKVLKSQGANAPGGEKSWIVNGAMTGGFGFLAWPAEYGSSGVMTFMVGPDGVIRQKDLGNDTPAQAQAIAAFNPDSSWKVANE